MRSIVLLGRFSGDFNEPPHVLYCGLDGSASQKAAAKACASGKYQDGGNILEIRNASGRPFPVVPHVPKPTNKPEASGQDSGAKSDPKTRTPKPTQTTKQKSQ